MQKTLIWIDYVIIAATLIISAGIGLYFRFTGGRQRTTEVNDSFIIIAKSI